MALGEKTCCKHISKKYKIYWNNWKCNSASHNNRQKTDFNKHTDNLRRMPNISLHEKYPNTEFFLIRIFLHSDWMRWDTPYLSVFSPNAGKYGPEKTRVWTLFTQFMLHVLRWIRKFLPVEMAKLLGNSFIEKPDQLCTFD